jgi:alpha-beta hydrolase superfamily lysophospholipase
MTTKYVEAAFRAALPELGLPATFFDVSYKGKTLPGVFLQNPDKQAPVVLLFGGADTCFEEIYFTVGRYLYDSGYSVAMADLPGQGITMKDGYHWEAEAEKPIGAIVDLLVERFGAKPGRMAMLGYSLGGYFATRAAGHEKRFATVMASTPLPRPGLAFAAAGKQMAADAAKASSARVRNLQIILWKAGATDMRDLLAKLSHFVADPALVTVPFLSVVGAG